MAITLPLGQLINILGGSTTYELTEGARSPLSVTYDRLETTRRTARGNRRRYFVADKRNFSVDWFLIPGQDANTVDGKMGFINLLAMYESLTGPVTLKVRKRDGSREDISVHIVGFNYERLYRYLDDDWYQCAMTFEEI